MAEPAYLAHVVSHTHWDREWHRTFEQFRARLVDMTDALLDLLDADPRYACFYWDGQTVVIDDYLAIRPENAERLRQAFASGRLYTGPWFVQPDEFLVSGESMVRNLLAGRRDCERWGTGTAVGYAPDAFGHTSQMPQVLQGFGIDNAVVFRGITADQVGSEFRWLSPDGTGVLCIKMSDDNAYSNFFYRFRESLADTDGGRPLRPERVEAEASALLEDCIAERPSTGHLLWMDGVDHVFAQPRTPDILEVVNERLGERVRAVHSSLPAFLDAVREAAPGLPEVTGELRVSNRAWRLQALLAHVASSRMNLKQLNHRCETLLERWAEPWSAIAWSLGRPYPAAHLAEAWRWLLLNQAHDSICGCSIDGVHRDMLPRYEHCLEIGGIVAAEALGWVADQVDTSAKAPVGALCALVVANPLAMDRSGESVEAIVELPAALSPAEVGVVDAAGEELPAVIEPMRDYHLLRQAPHDIPVGEHRKRWRVRFEAGAPSLGVRTCFVAPRAEPLPAPVVRAGGRSIRNAHLRVALEPDGSLTLTDLATGTERRGLLVFESGGDFGDGYNYVPPANDTVMATAEPRVDEELASWTQEDALGASLYVRRRWYLPARRDGDRRSEALFAPVDLAATIILTRGARRIEVELTVTNGVRDHRLRVLFPSGAVGADVCGVEQAFDVVDREIARPDCTGWREPRPGTGPQKTFVDVSAGGVGLCVINRGLPEYEVLDDARRTIALTLLRCTGNGVGAPEQQEDGQMQGVWQFAFALLPHAGSWEQDTVWREAHAFNAPMRAVQTGLRGGSLSVECSFVSVRPASAVLTALKRSEDGDALVARVVGVGREASRAEAANALGFDACRAARIDETPAADLLCTDGRVAFDLPSRRIATLRFERRRVP